MELTIPSDVFLEVTQSLGYRPGMNGPGGTSAVLHCPEGTMEATITLTQAFLSAKFARGRDPLALRRQVESHPELRKALGSLGASLRVGEDSPPRSHGFCAVRTGFAGFSLMREQMPHPCSGEDLAHLLKAFRAAVFTGALPFDVSCERCGSLPAEPLPPRGPFRLVERVCQACRAAAVPPGPDLRGWLTPGRDPGLFRYLETWASEVGAPLPTRLECKVDAPDLHASSPTTLVMPVRLWAWLSIHDFRVLVKGALAPMGVMGGLLERVTSLFTGGGSLEDLHQAQQDYESGQADVKALLERIPAEERAAASARLYALAGLGDEPYRQPISAWRAVLAEAGPPPEWPSAEWLAVPPSAPAFRLLSQGAEMVRLLEQELRSPAPAPTVPSVDYSQDRLARLAARWSEWLEEHPDSADGWTALACLHEGSKERREAAEAAERALALNPDHSLARATLDKVRPKRPSRPLPPDAAWLLTNES